MMKRLGTGVFYTLLDIAMGTAASLAGAAPTATIVLSTSILDPSPSPFFTCTAKVICSRDGMSSAEGWVYRSDQTLAAIGHGDFKLLKKRG
ncbi:PaaI family thioesterase [Metabacillus sp. SLBN-84]